MTSPNFKVLVNALQLGQPPDVASIRAVVEQLLAQQEEIAALRREVAMLHNRMAALTVAAGHESGGPPASYPPPDVGDTGPMAVGPSAREHQRYVESGYSDGPGSSPYSEQSASSPRGDEETRRRVTAANPGQLAQGQAAGVPSVVEDFESSEYEDFHGTVVIKGAEAEPRGSAEAAPFPMAPAGAPHRHNSEIPGAPWAREAVEPAPMSGPRGVGPDIYDTYTIDSEARPQPLGESSEPPPRVETDFEDEGAEHQRRHRRRDRR